MMLALLLFFFFLSPLCTRPLNTIKIKSQATYLCTQHTAHTHYSYLRRSTPGLPCHLRPSPETDPAVGQFQSTDERHQQAKRDMILISHARTYTCMFEKKKRKSPPHCLAPLFHYASSFPPFPFSYVVTVLYSSIMSPLPPPPPHLGLANLLTVSRHRARNALKL